MVRLIQAAVQGDVDDFDVVEVLVVEYPLQSRHRVRHTADALAVSNFYVHEVDFGRYADVCPIGKLPVAADDSRDVVAVPVVVVRSAVLAFGVLSPRQHAVVTVILVFEVVVVNHAAVQHGHGDAFSLPEGVVVPDAIYVDGFVVGVEQVLGLHAVAAGGGGNVRVERDPAHARLACQLTHRASPDPG